MRTMTVEEMGEINGGSWWGCAGGIVGLIGSGASMAASAAAVQAGLLYLSMWGFAFSLGSVVANC